MHKQPLQPIEWSRLYCSEIGERIRKVEELLACFLLQPTTKNSPTRLWQNQINPILCKQSSRVSYQLIPFVSSSSQLVRTRFPLTFLSLPLLSRSSFFEERSLPHHTYPLKKYISSLPFPLPPLLPLAKPSRIH